MASDLYIVILLVWTAQCADSFNVEDTSLIQIAFAGEQVNATCKASSMTCKSASPNLDISYYQSDLAGKEIRVYNYQKPDACIVNTTWSTNHDLQIKPTMHRSVTGTYYCQIKLNSVTRRGKGTFILFRDKGYIEPSLTVWNCLVTLTVILAALSIIATALLVWKREVVWSGKNYVKRCPDKRPTAQKTSSSLEPHESMYTFTQGRLFTVHG